MLSRKKKVLKETWCWNKDVQECIQQKKKAKRRWDREGSEERNREYKKCCKQVKKAVVLVRVEAYRGLYESLESKEGKKEAYRIAKHRDEASKDVQKIRVIKDADGTPLISEGDILRWWQECFEKLMNEDNDHEKITDLASGTKREMPRVNMEEVRNAMKKMKNGKAVGPDKIPVEAWKCLGEAAVDLLTRLVSKILQSGEMPKDWRYRTLIPIFKSKGVPNVAVNIET